MTSKKKSKMELSKINMWKIKAFKTKEEFDSFINNNSRRYQIVEIFLNNYYRGVEYRKLKKIL